MRYRWSRIDEILYHDPTRNLQLLGAFSSWVRAIYALVVDPFQISPVISPNLFAYVPVAAWALTLILLGLLQWWAAGTRRWHVKFWTANLQACITAYGLAVAFLTVHGESPSVPFWILCLVIHVWVATRTLHDKELNGTDRRNTDSNPRDSFGASPPRWET